jgi:hypothetical protein
MKTTILSVVILTLTAVGPAQAQFSDLNVIGSIFGSIHPIGLVSKGDRVTADIVAITTSSTTCPIKVTILVVQENAGSKVHKVTKSKTKLQARA